MGNDIEIRVKVANNTATGLAAVNRSLNRLRDEANDAGRGLDGLAARATAASVALRALKDSAQDASRALRSLNTAARNADGRMSTMSDRSRALRRDTDDLDGSMRSLTTTMGGLRGNNGRLNASFGNSGDSMQKLKAAAIALSPALIPIAAAAAPFAAGLGAAAASVAAFGAAIGRQVAAMSKATEAEKKYKDAVKEHGGAGSEEAAKAARELQIALADMPAATQQAAAGLMVFKETYKSWSDSLAGDTMPVVTKSFALFGAMLPRLTPLVRGTSEQLDRLMNVAAGGIQSAGFERFMQSFSEFASGALSRATTGLVKFSQALDAGKVGGGLHEFMQFVRETGPLVGETLRNLGEALGNLVVAASDTGVGVLTVANALAKLVNAVPSAALSAFVQLYAALKLVKVGIAGVAAVASSRAAAGVAAFVRAAQFGGVASAISGVTQRMSTLQKVGGSLGVLGVAALGINELAKASRGAPPDVDRLSDSLKSLAATGKFTGELRSTFGDIDGFIAKLDQLDQSTKELDTAKPFLDLAPGGPIVEKLAGKVDDLVNGTKSLGATKDDFKALDETFASMVKTGHAKIAAQDFAKLEAAMRKNGRSTEYINSAFSRYKEKVAALKDEQDLAARGMGIFGDQALAVQGKLDAQKGAADGLRASILALNEVNRSAYDAQIGFEASLDSLTASFKEHGATLNLDTEAGRANATAMSQAAKSQDELIATGLAAGESLGSMTGKSQKLRGEMMRLAVEAFGGNKKAATEYVNTLLGVPSEIKTLVKAERAEAITGLKDVQAAIKRTPGAKSIKVDTLNGAAIKALEAVGLKTKRLPDGRTQVFTANGKSLGSIGAVARALSRLNGKTANTYTTHHVRTKYSTQYDSNMAKSFRKASGGPIRLAGGGNPGGRIAGPGTSTSDSIPAMLSDGEWVIRAAAVAKYGDAFMNAVNTGRYRPSGFAKGGPTKKQQAARKAAEKEREARKAATPELTITHFGQKAGYQNPEIRNQLRAQDSIGPLVSALNQWRGVIMKSTHGGTERSLLRRLDAAGGALIKYQRNLDKVNKSLEKAKDKLDDLKSAASQLSSGVKSGILSGANITRAAGAEDSRLTINTLLSQMTGSAANSKQFASMLKQLKGRGLRGDLIEQIAEAGIEGGGMETAAAVLGGGKEPIRRLNELQKQITANAKAAGSTAADAMYGVGLKAAEGLVKGLTSQQNRIEATMLIIAKSMEKSIKKALGIRSPSKVMEPVGEFSMRGVEVGWSKRLAKGHTMLSGKTPAWASMLNAPRTNTAGPAAAASGGGSSSQRPIVLNVSLGGREFGQIWVDVGRKEVSTRGGLRATLGGMD